MIKITGDPEKAKEAEQLIQELAANSLKVEIPSNLVKRFIGKNGSNIKAIEQRSGAKIEVY